MNFGFRSRETGLDEHTAISSENFTARRACLSGDLGKTAGIESGDQTRGKEREPRKREATRERHSEITCTGHGTQDCWTRGIAFRENELFTG